MFFIDSVVLISAKRKRDKWHKRGLEIVEKIADGHIGRGYLLDYVLLETINYLHKKDGYTAALNALSELLNSEYLELLVADEIAILNAQKIMNQFHELSLTDAVISYYMKLLDVSVLYSFDSDFDSIPWIDRMTEI